MTTLKHEIKKLVFDYTITNSSDSDNLTNKLQKLFLSKQIELLDDLFIVRADLIDIREEKERLESELKQLQ